MTSETGLSFCIGDLLLATAWSEAQSLRLDVRLDYGSAIEPYEEVLALHAGTSEPLLWIWRNSGGVAVLSAAGCLCEFETLADVFEALAPERYAADADIQAVRWPGVTCAEPVQA